MSTRLICAPLLLVLAILLPDPASPQARAPDGAVLEATPLVPEAPAPPRYDCNGNGVEDAVDIALGTSCDADLDGVPDECQGAEDRRRRPLEPGLGRGS